MTCWASRLTKQASGKVYHPTRQSEVELPFRSYFACLVGRNNMCVSPHKQLLLSIIQARYTQTPRLWFHYKKSQSWSILPIPPPSFSRYSGRFETISPGNMQFEYGLFGRKAFRFFDAFDDGIYSTWDSRYTGLSQGQAAMIRKWKNGAILRHPLNG